MFDATWSWRYDTLSHPLLQKKEPQLVEEERSALFLRSTTCSESMRALLLDLYRIRGPETSKNFTRKTEERPFENDASFRFLCEKNNSSLFVLGSHSKKRPDNMILARMFEFNVLDMYELGLTSIRSIADFRQETFAVGSKPFMLFQGDAFENHPTYQQLKSLFMDFFCSKPLVSFVPAAMRQGHVIVLSALADGSVTFRHYRLDAFAVEGRTSPGAQLTEIGPRCVCVCVCVSVVAFHVLVLLPRVCLVFHCCDFSVRRFNMKIGRTVAGEHGSGSNEWQKQCCHHWHSAALTCSLAHIDTRRFHRTSHPTSTSTTHFTPHLHLHHTLHTPPPPPPHTRLQHIAHYQTFSLP